VKALFLLAIALCAVSPATAQLESPNDTGVAMGQIHVVVNDIEVQKKFWVMLGGVPVKSAPPLTLIQFPGTFVVLEHGTSTGGTVGSVVGHIGFFVKDIEAGIIKWKAAGIKFEQSNPKQAMLTGPDGVTVEIHEDASLLTPVKMHHVHFFGTDPSAMQAWYLKTFGAVSGKRATFLTATIPGAELAFSKAEVMTAPTKGRALDRIGFEVKDLDAFSKRLEAQALKLDGPIQHTSRHSKTRVAFLTDPWGTSIELTENLAPK